MDTPVKNKRYFKNQKMALYSKEVKVETWNVKERRVKNNSFLA